LPQAASLAGIQRKKIDFQHLRAIQPLCEITTYGDAVVKVTPAPYTLGFEFRSKLFINRDASGVIGDMRFKLLDRIVDLKPGVSITAVKSLALAEDYLADHFPQFPVMPGVFMLEAMTQAGAWLVRSTDDFRHSIVVLREARNIKYADFVRPGQVLTATAEITGRTEHETKLKVQGTVDGRTNVSAKLVLAHYNMAEHNPVCASADAHVIRQMRLQFSVLYRPEPSASLAATNGSVAGAHAVAAT
jgi:3-hydroxyacyl-[acyl-carrier-protein] dehydratase